jgi:hypothetical protein
LEKEGFSAYSACSAVPEKNCLGEDLGHGIGLDAR